VESAPGNVGFFDQLLALKWVGCRVAIIVSSHVRENIHQFGGDKDQITIFGESAGSWSTSAHIVSPLTKGLFRRAIMQSGAHMYNKDRDVISKSEALDLAKQTARQLNCSDDDQWLQCLKGVGADDLLQQETKLETFPVLGTEYLPLSEQKAFLDHKFNKGIDLMAGITQNEGSFLSRAIDRHIEGMTVDRFQEDVLKTDHMFHGLDVQKVTDFYLKGVNRTDPVAIRWAFYDFFGDLFMKCPTYLFAKRFKTIVKHRKNVYFYVLTYVNPLAAKLLNCDPATMGVCHTMDIPFVFGLPLTLPQVFTPEDQVFSRQVMKMWTDFAKYGKPDEVWPQLLDNNVVKVRDLNPVNISRDSRSIQNLGY
ncbi:unnamed protein product, partial [Oppiella nova]